MAEYQGIAERQNPGLPPQPRHNALSADRGWHWILDAFRLVKPQFGTWFLLCLIFFIIMAVLSVVPAGSFVWMLLQPILGAGLIFACQELERGEELEIGQLFIGFQRNPTQLALIGVIGFAVSIGIVLLAMLPLLLLGGTAVLAALANPQALAALGGTALLAVMLFLLVLLVLLMPLTMAMWFATALVLFDNLQAWQAFKISYRGCMANLMPFLVFGLIGMVLCVVAAMPLGLGLFLLLPVLFATGYTSYRDVFGAEPL